MNLTVVVYGYCYLRKYVERGAELGSTLGKHALWGGGRRAYWGFRCVRRGYV